MYAALWRVLPGPVWLRVLILLVALAVVLVVLTTVVFPWIQTLLPESSGTVGTN